MVKTPNLEEHQQGIIAQELSPIKEDDIRDCYVYLMTNEEGFPGWVKCGIGNDPSLRRKTAQTYSPFPYRIDYMKKFATREKSRRIELLVHWKFDKSKHGGREWVHAPLDKVQNYIRKLEEKDYLESEFSNMEMKKNFFWCKEKIPTIEYADIDPINDDTFRRLEKKKITEGLTDMEQVQIAKYWYRPLVVDVPRKREDALWRLYWSHGRGKFRNLRREKWTDEGWKSNVKDDNYSGLQKLYALRLEWIERLKGWLGLKHTQDYGVMVTKKMLMVATEELEKKEKDIRLVFELRKSQKKKGFNTLRFVNQIFEKWGFSKLKRGERKRKRVDGKQIDVSPYVIASTLPNLPCGIECNKSFPEGIYSYIRGYNKYEEKPKGGGFANTSVVQKNENEIIKKESPINTKNADRTKG